MLYSRIIAIIILAFAITNFAKAQSNEEINLAKQAIYNFSLKNYEKACFSFDIGLKSLMPDSISKVIWESLLQKYGNFEKELELTTKNLGNQNSISINCKFEKAEVITTFVTYQDTSKVYKIGAVYFLPKSKDNSYLYPTYINKKLFESEKLDIRETYKQNENIILNFNSEIEGSPLVIFISDLYKNEYNKDNEFQLFRDIAWGLASKGLTNVQVSMNSNQNIIDSLYLTKKLNSIYEKIKRRKEIDTNVIYIITSGVTSNLIFNLNLDFKPKGLLILNPIISDTLSILFGRELGNNEKKKFSKYSEYLFTKNLKECKIPIYINISNPDSFELSKELINLSEKSKNTKVISIKDYKQMNKYFCKTNSFSNENKPNFDKYVSSDLINDLFNVIFETK